MDQRNPLVYLGFLDEQVNQKNKKYLCHTVSKIGGYPNWCTRPCEIPTCIECKRVLVLILQLYAPLDGSFYHRTLYVFACITPTCWSNPLSWVCLRSQFREQKSTESKNSEDKSKSTDFWMDDDDDWTCYEETNNANDNDNGNSFSSSFTNKTTQNVNQTLDNVAVYDRNLNQNTAMEDVTLCLETKFNLNEAICNANEQFGAFGVDENGCVGMEASALIEGPEGDMVAVETPERPSTDIIALFKEVPSGVKAEGEVSLVSYFVSVDVEPHEDTKFTEHERELFVRYTQTSGQNLKEEDGVGESSHQMGDNVYEKNSVSHGDSFLYKFKKRVSRCQQQIVRYCREEDCKPLWVRPPNYSEIPKMCSSCGSKMQFEAQLMPQLVSSLRVQDLPNPVLEFGTVVMYTCSASCWSDDSIIKTEFCYLQAEEI